MMNAAIETLSHRPAGNGYLSRAIFVVDGATFEACRFTRADGESKGVEIYSYADGLAEFLGYAESLFQLPAAEVALEILAR